MLAPNFLTQCFICHWIQLWSQLYEVEFVTSIRATLYFNSLRIFHNYDRCYSEVESQFLTHLATFYDLHGHKKCTKKIIMIIKLALHFLTERQHPNTASSHSTFYFPRFTVHTIIITVTDFATNSVFHFTVTLSEQGLQVMLV